MRLKPIHAVAFGIMCVALSNMTQQCELREHREQIKDLQRRCAVVGQ